MTEKQIVAIKEFTADLWRAFAHKKERELGMYCRLINTTTPSDVDRITQFVTGFKEFFLKYDNAIIEGRLESLSVGEKILFNGNPNISIDIQRFIHKSDHTSKESIRKHLLNISNAISPSKDKSAALNKDMDELGIDVSTKEGVFISDLLQSANGLGLEDVNDPMMAMAAMMQSGLLGKLFSGLKDGDFDLNNLTSSLEGLIGKVPPEMRGKIHDMSTKIATLTKPPAVDVDDLDVD